MKAFSKHIALRINCFALICWSRNGYIEFTRSVKCLSINDSWNNEKNQRLWEDSPLDHILKEDSMDEILEMEDPQIWDCQRLLWWARNCATSEVWLKLLSQFLLQARIPQPAKERGTCWTMGQLLGSSCALWQLPWTQQCLSINQKTLKTRKDLLLRAPRMLWMC